MRRIFWDSMLLIYLLDNVPEYVERVQELLIISRTHNDKLFTSYLGLGELMAGAGKTSSSRTAALLREAVDEIGFTYLSFDATAVNTFSRLRSDHRIKPPDAIHLACAAAAGMDLFLTHDARLTKLHVPGIHFIQGFNTPLLQRPTS